MSLVSAPVSREIVSLALSPSHDERLWDSVIWFILLMHRIESSVRHSIPARLRVPDMRNIRIAILTFSFLASVCAGNCFAELPNPVLNTIFPAGAKVGETVEVDVAGGGLDEISGLYRGAAGFQITQNEQFKNRFTITIPPDMPLGVYDLRAICRNGMSSPRSFFVGNRQELLEGDNNEETESAQHVPLDVTINGRIEKPGDVDQFRFDATKGQRVVIECWAERIDSRLRGVLEVFDADGKQLASNRGYFGVDPLIDFRVPADGSYFVKLYDLVFAGSAEYYYRLDVDTGPRVAFVFPAVVERGKQARVTLYGWNLNAKTLNEVLDRIDVDIPAEITQPAWPLPIRLQPCQSSLEGFAYYFPGGHAPVLIGLADVPVVNSDSGNHSSDSAQQIPVPCEVSGQLVAGNQQDWFTIDGRRGEVLYFEGFGQRINSPIDLDIRVFDPTGQHELAQFADELRNLGGIAFPTSHLDPAGRWVVPNDGRFLILVRNVIGGLADDPRRVYRLSVRREEPDFSLTAIPRLSDSAGLNVPRGGRASFDIIAERRRGLSGAIRVSALDLPDGIECPDVWLGPGVDRTTLVVSADDDAPEFAGQLRLNGSTETIDRRAVRGGVIVRTGIPNGWGRVTSEIPLAVAGDAPLRITANGDQPRDHQLYGELKVRQAPGGILDVAVQVERRETQHQAPVKLIGVGLPDLIANETATIPAGEEKGYISFYLPRNLPVGRYSLGVRGETTCPSSNNQTETVAVYSNIVNFDVQPPAFFIEVDPYAPRRIKRGEVVQVNYAVRRVNGFIGKIHTELATPDKVTDVPGLRGRGVTSVGETTEGTIQIIANDDAPLGQQPFLRLYGVGTLEDEPVFHGSTFLNLEVIE